MDLGEMGPYTTVHDQSGAHLGGIGPLDPRDRAGARWLSYVGVANVDGAVKRVALLGGKVKLPPTAILNVGRFAVIEDPDRAELALFER